MSDRLKQIWKGFENASGRSLTAVNAARGLPDLEDIEPTEEQRRFEAEFERPADVALDAIREMKGGKKKAGERSGGLFSPRRKHAASDGPVFDDGAEALRATERGRPSYLDALEDNGGRPLYAFDPAPRKRGWFALGGKKAKKQKSK